MSAQCAVVLGIERLLYLYMILMLVYAVISWLPNLRGRWTYYVAMLVEPVLLPVRRVIPPMGGLDLSFIVVLLVLQMVLMPLVRQLGGPYCY